MANQWLRLWHEMPTDPKWKTIARYSKQHISLVQAVYMHLLVTASRNVTRGHADVTAEDLASALDCDEEQIEAILAAMQGRVLDGRRLTGWEMRQPKREDSGDDEGGAKSSAERKRAQREREKQREAEAGFGGDVPPCHDASRNVTTDKDKDKDKEEEEEEEEEKNTEPNGSVGRTDLDPDPKTGKGKNPDHPAKPSLPNCNAQAVVDAYHAVLPELPKVRLMNEQRRKAIRKLWQWVLTSKKSDNTPRAETAEQALEWIRGYFTRARDNDFLMGRGQRSGEHANWQCDLDFLLTDRGMKHVIEKTRGAT